MDIDQVTRWRGRKAVDADGENIGSIEEVYLDQDSGVPEWLTINTGLFGTKQSFVPITGASDQGDNVHLGYTKQQVKHAPNVDASSALSQQEEAELYRHYGLDYGEARSDSGLPENGRGTAVMGDTTGLQDEPAHRHDPTPTGSPEVVGNDVSGPETDSAMTRSEEELRVGTAQREAGRARLRKHVVTEKASTTVPVEREQLRVEREPITDANAGKAMAGPAISEEEHEVVLHEERVVVDKQAVAKERVRLDKETVTEEQQVSDQLRKEQVELIDADGQPREGIDGVRGTDDGIDR